MNNKPKMVGLLTPTVIDYRNRLLGEAPQGIYSVTIVMFLYTGHPLLEVVDGEHRGKVFIGSKMFAFDAPQTLH